MAAEQLVLEGNQFHVTGGDGGGFDGELSDLVEAIRKASVTGLDAEPQPRHSVRWKVVGGPLTVVIQELDPELRRMMWIAPDSPQPRGKEARYEPRQLATPYIVLKVPFMHGRVTGRVELFYRNRPLEKLDDELYWSNLLNVSPHAYHCKAWLCTQYLAHELAGAPPGVTSGLNALMHHTFGLGGWNWSSDLSEGKSAFTLAKEMDVDPRVIDVDRWEQESLADPKFVLQVPWKPVGLTVRQLIQDEFKINRAERNLGQASEMVNLLMAARNGKPK
jgi:hypothetical protein